MTVSLTSISPLGGNIAELQKANAYDSTAQRLCTIYYSELRKRALLQPHESEAARGWLFKCKVTHN